MDKPLKQEETEYARKVIERYDDEIYFKTIELRHFIKQLTSVTSEIERLTDEKLKCAKFLKDME